MEFQFKMGAKNTNLGPLGILIISLLFALIQKSYGNVSDCKFPAIFNFGDSNSDTGSGGAPERACDGRLIIDFFAEKLGFPDLNGYPKEGANYSKGVNFAIFASTVYRIGENIDSFHALDERQLSWFVELRNRSLEMYASKGELTTLPKPQDFSKALYTIDIGQNDVAVISSFSFNNFATAISIDISRLADFIQKLYKLDARRFWIHNTGPIGCIFPGGYVPKDDVGCCLQSNKECQEFNKQLKNMVDNLRSKFKDASFVYVDIYSAKYSLYRDADKLGFKDPFGHPKCADKKAASCPRKEYILWDGLHYTEIANKMVADLVMDGSHSDPPLPLAGACHPDSPKTKH